jgi:hypothetical protein
VSLTIWQDCVFSFVSFVFLCFLSFVSFVGLMDMSNMEEDQVMHDATQVVGESGASPSMMGLHDVLINIEQILIPFKHYILKHLRLLWHKLIL